MEASTTNPDLLDWTLARGMIEEFLPRSRWAEEVLAIEKGEPGRLEVRAADAMRRFWYSYCDVRVRLEGGREAERKYSFAFDWREGRWQLIEMPAVG